MKITLKMNRCRAEQIKNVGLVVCKLPLTGFKQFILKTNLKFGHWQDSIDGRRRQGSKVFFKLWRLPILTFI